MWNQEVASHCLLQSLSSPGNNLALPLPVHGDGQSPLCSLAWSCITPISAAPFAWLPSRCGSLNSPFSKSTLLIRVSANWFRAHSNPVLSQFNLIASAGHYFLIKPHSQEQVAKTATNISGRHNSTHNTGTPSQCSLLVLDNSNVHRTLSGNVTNSQIW